MAVKTVDKVVAASPVAAAHWELPLDEPQVSIAMFKDTLFFFFNL